MTERVINHFPDTKRFEALLESAEAADPRGDAADFVAEMREKYDKYGQAAFLSGRQKEWLERIAGESA